MIVRLAQALALVAVLLGGMPAAQSSEVIEVTSVRLEPTVEGDAWQLSADFVVPLSARLEDAVQRGVALYFIAEFQLVKPRWYWWDESTVSASRSYRLSYHPLTSQYRLVIGSYQIQFPTLSEAVRAMSLIRGWRVMEVADLKAGATYEAQLRLRLDTTQLPKPFQITALTNRDWNLQTEWKRFPFIAETPKTAR